MDQKTPKTSKFTPDELLWLLGLPAELAEKLNWDEARTLVRQPPEEWPEELKKKVEGYIEL